MVCIGCEIIGKKMTYPMQFSIKVLKTKKKEKQSFIDVAKKFGLSKTTIFKWSKKLAPQETRIKPWKKLSKESLIKDIEQFPDSYSYERAERLWIGESGIKYAIKQLGITYKKNSKSSESGSRKKIYVLPKN